MRCYIQPATGRYSYPLVKEASMESPLTCSLSPCILSFPLLLLFLLLLVVGLIFLKKFVTRQ